MALTDMTRRSFMKLAGVAAAVGAVGVTSGSNLTRTTKAYAENEITKQVTQCRACPRACGVIAHIQNGRVIKLQGDKNDIFSQGGMCGKGTVGHSGALSSEPHEVPHEARGGARRRQHLGAHHVGRGD